MRKSIAALVFLSLASAAQAAEAEGTIQSVDPEALTITLSDGRTYRLPPELDIESIKVGVEVVIAYDKVGEENRITDMDIWQ